MPEIRRNPDINQIRTKMKQPIHQYAHIYAHYRDNLPEIPKDEISRFRSEVHEAFNLIPVNVCYVDGQPYKDVDGLSRDIVTRHVMRISTEFNDSVLLPGELNLKFRAVHDWLHYLTGQPFTFDGEYNVYLLQRAYHRREIGRQMLFSEVVLQAAYAEHFGKFAEKQKVILIPEK